MSNFNPSGMSRNEWGRMSNPSVFNYNHNHANFNVNTSNRNEVQQCVPHPVPTPSFSVPSLEGDKLKKLAEIQIQMLNKPNLTNVGNIPNIPFAQSNSFVMRQPTAPLQHTLPYNNRYNPTQPSSNYSLDKPTSFGSGFRPTGGNPSLNKNYKPNQPIINPPRTQTSRFDSKRKHKVTTTSTCDPASLATDSKYNPFTEDNVEDNMDISDDEGAVKSKGDESQLNNLKGGKIEVKSGASFYTGLILFIPPFEQILGNSSQNSPAMKMLYASFEFSFKTPIRIETKPTDITNVSDATVLFRDNVIATGRGTAPHIEASTRALELLSETCYTIQAKQDYFLKCKLLNGLDMKTLNLKKWEYVSQKHPKIEEVTKDSHIQKTFAVFLSNHTSTGVYEDIVFCNLTRQDVNHVKKVVDFFNLTMLPCSMQTKLSMKQTPCIVSIHKYTSAKKLLEVLMDCGGENEHFTVYPPDTFRDFYKLHPVLKSTDPSNKENCVVSTLEDKVLQVDILKPYGNIISELFAKNKSLQEQEKDKNKAKRKPGDDFMMQNLKIDMVKSINVEPVERMQLLLKYMEQLQEYGNRVLTSGKTEMIKIYHNAIENLRKDLDTCRQDIEKQQKEKSLKVIQKNPGTFYSEIKRSSPSQRRRSRSPDKKSSNYDKTKNRSISPHRKFKARSRSPKRLERARRSGSPRRRPRTPSPRRTNARAQFRTSPVRRPRPSQNNDVLVTIFGDKFKRYTDNLRKFRIEIEDTPIERRSSLQDRLDKYREAHEKFHKEVWANRSQLGGYRDELEILREELVEQTDLIKGKPGPNDLPRSVTPPMWMNVRSFEPPAPTATPVMYPNPSSRSMYGAAHIPPSSDPYRRAATGQYW